MASSQVEANAARVLLLDGQVRRAKKHMRNFVNGQRQGDPKATGGVWPALPSDLDRGLAGITRLHSRGNGYLK